MDANTIAKLTALLEKFPEVKTKLMTMSNMDDAVALVKSKGLEIAKAELQEYITKKLVGGAAKDLLGKAGKGGVGDLLKGMLG